MRIVVTAPAEAANEPLCVPFREAVWWIACQNLAGWCRGPVPLSIVFSDTHNEEDDAAARFAHALDLLLNHAARGKVRLYAGSFSLGQFNQGQVNLLLDPAFIAKARYVEEDDGEISVLYVPEEEEGDEEEGGGRAEDLAVDYRDLTEQFWGTDRAAESSPTAAASHQPARPPVPPAALRRSAARRRGRPPEYDWPAFLAEALRRCLTGRIARQGELETQMLQWCVEQWDKEPSESQVRDYAGAAFRAVEASRSPGV
jgi:hypothetical protein